MILGLPSTIFCRPAANPLQHAASSRFLVSGSADNTMRLWSVETGKCLFFWEFPTAVKRVAFNEDDDQVVCITEQRMGHQGAVRVFDINRDGDGTNRTYSNQHGRTNCEAYSHGLLT